ncbi:hypothetical protein WS1820 [Wolinella succinogenes]|uniref:STAS domain-containing protein n=2 Tax=Wolinella succinogenes TaxID=844 RepID=Q7MR13_WOLSU|nr:hypothetical protein WS1820 [Wolinella succinogenes]
MFVFIPSKTKGKKVMEIELTRRGSDVLAEISGVIKGNVDSEKFKKAIDECGEITRLEIIIKESFSITSTIIGYLNKKSAIKKVRVLLSIRDKRLYDLLDELNLLESFNVTLIQ